MCSLSTRQPSLSLENLVFSQGGWQHAASRVGPLGPKVPWRSAKLTAVLSAAELPVTPSQVQSQALTVTTLS